MYKEIIFCENCESFGIIGERIYTCKNKDAIPFPNPKDYCSKAISRTCSKSLINEEILLEQVYKQRRK